MKTIIHVGILIAIVVFRIRGSSKTANIREIKPPLTVTYMQLTDHFILNEDL